MNTPTDSRKDGGAGSRHDYMDFPQPSISLYETIGGYFRVELHGPDYLRDNQVYFVADIGRGPTKEAALAQAREWFDGFMLAARTQL